MDIFSWRSNLNPDNSVHHVGVAVPGKPGGGICGEKVYWRPNVVGLLVRTSPREDYSLGVFLNLVFGGYLPHGDIGITNVCLSRAGISLHPATLPVYA